MANESIVILSMLGCQTKTGSEEDADLTQLKKPICN